MLRRRPVWSALAGLAAASFLSAPWAWLGGPIAAVAAWVFIGRTEPPRVRREREAARRDLPHVVGLLADALRSGQSPDAALALVVEALPGPASDRLTGIVARLELGVEPDLAWAELAADPALAPLGRTMQRAHATGASVVVAVDRLATSLAEDNLGSVEDRARAVGVKAAVPLGLCLLPSFVLLGIVPVVAGMLGTLGL
jgi:Flp pilus assembly protein TadB